MSHSRLCQIFREKKEALKEKKSNTILDKYGGAQHLNAPPPELLFAQTEVTIYIYIYIHIYIHIYRYTYVYI